MELHELQKQIIDKSPEKFYIFSGPEVGIMDIYLRKIQEVSEATIQRFDTVQEAVTALTKTRISSSRKCYVVRDDKNYLKEEKFWDKVEATAGSKNDILILLYSSMDKRSKFWKKYEKTIVLFEHLEAKALSGYIEKELPGMPVGARTSLAEVCGCDYSRIILECDKIRQYYNVVHFLDYGSCFQQLLQQGVIHQPIGDITFKLTDAIVTRNFKQVEVYLAQAKLKQEPEILLLSVLYNSFKGVLMVQGLGQDQSEPVKRTGLTPWQVKMAKEKMGHYSISELTNAISLIRKAEKGIKTGQMDATIAVDYVIVNIM